MSSCQVSNVVHNQLSQACKRRGGISLEECLQHCFNNAKHIRWKFLLSCGAVWPIQQNWVWADPNICGPWWFWTHLLHRLLSCSPYFDTECCACVKCFTMFSCRDYYSQQAVTHKVNIWIHCSNRVIQFRQSIQRTINLVFIHSGLKWSF